MDISFRFALESDCELLFNWRNDPVTRANSFNSDIIPFDNHKKWFLNSLNSKNRKILIAESEGRAIGTIRFDIDSLSLSKQAEVSINIAPEYRHQGYGSQVLKDGCSFIKKALGIEIFTAKIKTQNNASFKAFSHAGFQLSEKSNQFFEMILNFKKK